MVWKREVSKKGSDSKSVTSFSTPWWCYFRPIHQRVGCDATHWYERNTQNTHIICLSTYTVIIKICIYIYILIPPGLLCFNVFLHMSANSVPGFLNPNQWVTSRRKTETQVKPFACAICVWVCISCLCLGHWPRNPRRKKGKKHWCCVWLPHIDALQRWLMV